MAEEGQFFRPVRDFCQGTVVTCGPDDALVDVVRTHPDVVCFFVGATTPQDRPYLEQIQSLLARHWKRGAVEKAEAVRAALGMLLAELKKEFPDDDATRRRES